MKLQTLKNIATSIAHLLGSIKTRVTLFALVLFLAGAWSLILYAGKSLREDAQNYIGNEQLTIANYAAHEIDQIINARIKSLQDTAVALTSVEISERSPIPESLRSTNSQPTLFDHGLFVLSLDGKVVADWSATRRKNAPSSFRHFDISHMLSKNGASVIRSSSERDFKESILNTGAPIFDNKGRVSGFLVGLTSLNSHDFFRLNTDSKLSRGYLLIDKGRRVIAAADSATQQYGLTSQSNADSLIEAIQQRPGETIDYTDAQGATLLISAKDLTAANWLIAITTPSSQVFAPITEMQNTVFRLAIIITLLAGFLVWWMLWRELTPLFTTVGRLIDMAESGAMPHAIAPTRLTELNQLISSVNRLISVSASREMQLTDNELRYRSLAECTPESIVIHCNDVIIYVNQASINTFGDDLIGKTIFDLLHPDSHASARERLNLIAKDGLCAPVVRHKLLKADKSVMHAEVQTNTIMIAGHLTSHTFIHDITQKQLIEDDIRIAATSFESHDGMIVTDWQTNILRVNKAFTEITGYSPEDVIGRTPRILSSGLHDVSFYRRLWREVASKGSWSGEVLNRRKNGDTYPEWLRVTAVKNQSGITTHYVGSLTDISSQKATESEIENLAFFDALTQLPNRRLLMDRLTHAVASSLTSHHKGALFFIDLDNFKILNDTMGHDKGDMLLKEVACRLQKCVRQDDTVARLGGDEFVVMIENLPEDVTQATSQAEVIGENLLRALNEVYLRADRDHHSTASLGVTLFGDHIESIDEPLRRADMAMYQAKAAGRNTIRFFNPQMQVVVEDRAALEAGLREAISKNQFLLHYQIQVNGVSHVTGVEALVRWQHPEQGMISPAAFIPLAEDTGLILPLGEWVLETACKQLAIWSALPARSHLTISVNVSARQFHQLDFVNQVRRIIAVTNANPKLLKIELTESLLVTNIEDIIVKMSALESIGIGFSLDDFGTGYSSLSYLKRLPLTQLKIDQSFVRDILDDSDDAAIAKTIVALAAAMNLSVIAEGVETEGQRSALASHGCHAYQGYLFSRPLPVHALDLFLLQEDNKIPLHNSNAIDSV